MAETELPSTARIAAHPGKLIPGIPSFVFSVPQGWVIDEAPNALCVVRLPAPVEGFWVNAMVNHDKVSRELDFETLAKTTWARLKRTSPEAELNGERLMRLSGVPGYVRGVNLQAADGRPLAQVHAMVFAPVDGPGKVVDLFQIIGTCLRDDSVKASMEAFTEIIRTFRFV